MKIDYSLGDNLPENLKINENFSAEKKAEGIFITFAIPEKTNAYEVRIEGIGLVTENYFGVGKKDEDDFFYPFVAPNKEYTIRVKFLKEEVEKDGWNYGHPDGDGLIGWFDVKATAGANSKGEVRLTSKGQIDVKKNGDFRFTKKPSFENENLIQDWILNIGLNEGVSWLHDDRRSKWLTEIDIPNNEILNKQYNFYTYPRPNGDVTKVDFIVYRPRLFYRYGEKEYKYQWDGYTLDTNCTADAELWMNIDINNPANVAKIKGTWKSQDYWEEYNFNVDDNNHRIPLKCEWTEIYTINGQSIQEEFIEIYTKIDGSAFTEEEKGYWENYIYKEHRDTIEVSNYKVIGKVTENGTLSDFFENSDGTYSNKLNLSKDGKILRIIDDHKDYEYYDFFRQ